MPSEERYRAMIAVLREAAKSFDATLNAEARNVALLEAGLTQLRAVIRYLHSDPEVLDGRLTRPLGAIESAVFDAGRGATVPLLEHAPADSKKPQFTTREHVQGALAYAVEMLRASGMGQEHSVQQVASLARQFGVCTDGGITVTARQIASWRSEIRKERGASGAYETFETLRGMPLYGEVLRGPRTVAKRDRCEALARALVKSVAASSPLSAPKRALRAEPKRVPPLKQ